MAESEMTSFRLTADLVAALKQRAAADGQTVSEVLRRGALMLLGVCPTCGQDVPGAGKSAATEGQVGLWACAGSLARVLARVVFLPPLPRQLEGPDLLA